MTFPSGAPLDLLIDALTNRSAEASAAELHIRGYVGWLRCGKEESSAEIGVVAAAAATHEGAARTYREVAALGFAMSARRLGSEAFIEGMKWLVGRRFFVPNRPRSFEADGVAILGIVLGVLTVSDHPSQDSWIVWLNDFIMRSLVEIPTQTWDHSLVAAAGRLLKLDDNINAWDVELATDLRVALAAKGICAASASDEASAFQLISSLSYREFGSDRAATQLVALKWLLRATPTALPGKATVGDVTTVLEGVSRALRLWTWEKKPRTGKGLPIKWDIDNEYHVQNLLWIVLSPLFPDLEDEENLRSLGHKKPRADLLIPSLKLIIEAKFIRNGNHGEFAAIIGQVGEDASIYLTQPEHYNSIIAFVWDHSRRMEDHAELKNGLTAIPNVVGAVIVARPGKMDAMPIHPSATDSSSAAPI